MYVFNPLLFAIFPTFIDGSIPKDLIFNLYNGSNKMPSFEPISTTNLYFLILKKEVVTVQKQYVTLEMVILVQQQYLQILEMVILLLEV